MRVQIYRVNATATNLVIIKEPAATTLQIVQISQYLLPWLGLVWSQSVNFSILLFCIFLSLATAISFSASSKASNK